jgi:hypothetical protein
MLAAIREDFFHYTPLPAKKPRKLSPTPLAQQLTMEKTWKNYAPTGFCPIAGEVGLAF